MPRSNDFMYFVASLCNTQLDASDYSSLEIYMTISRVLPQ